MKVLLCGGGTAGHVMPAIAMAEIIKKHFPDSSIAFAGRKGGSENDSYKKTGHKLYEIEISGISRSLSINNIKTIFIVIKSGRLARTIIKEFNPDLIIGTGGYACYPFIRQGQRMNIKTIIHESNVCPGLVTKLLSGRCDKVLLNLEGSKEYLKKSENAIVVGNPTRATFNTLTKSEARRILGINDHQTLIVSFGGSLGADMINNAICKFISSYTINKKSIVHIHSTGKTHYNKVKSDFLQLFEKKENIRILPFIENMPTALTAADIAITRSGAITISELCRSRTPSILIPSPNVTGNHQDANARYMQKIGASIVIEEKDLNEDSLKHEIFELLQKPNKLKFMANCAYQAYQKNTEKLFVEVIRGLISDK